MFANDLTNRGWTDSRPLSDYAKGNWSIVFDTSSWMIVSTECNPRVFDVPVPGQNESRWTVNLIEHLCRMEDERARLRKALEMVRDLSGADEAADPRRRTRWHSATTDGSLTSTFPRGGWAGLPVPSAGRLRRTACRLSEAAADE
jgi:hypothetical protein